MEWIFNLNSAIGYDDNRKILSFYSLRAGIQCLMHCFYYICPLEQKDLMHLKILSTVDKTEMVCKQ